MQRFDVLRYRPKLTSER